MCVCVQSRQSRVVLLKAEDDHVSHLVKTEPKQEPADTYSLADLDGITDLLPIQTGILAQHSLLCYDAVI